MPRPRIQQLNGTLLGAIFGAIVAGPVGAAAGGALGTAVNTETPVPLRPALRQALAPLGFRLASMRRSSAHVVDVLLSEQVSGAAYILHADAPVHGSQDETDDRLFDLIVAQARGLHG